MIDGVLLVDLASYWGGTLTLQHEFAALSTEWLRGGPALALPPRELAKISLHTDTRRTATLHTAAAIHSMRDRVTEAA